eukprot:54221-Pyramimonas_sp.AAC.1
MDAPIRCWVRSVLCRPGLANAGWKQTRRSRLLVKILEVFLAHFVVVLHRLRQYAGFPRESVKSMKSKSCKAAFYRVRCMSVCFRRTG